MLFSLTKFISQPIITRIIVLAFTSLTILGSAASCGIPGLNIGNSNASPKILGVLKQDPNFILKDGTKRDGFGTINAVKLLNGQVQTDGLNQISGLQMIQTGKNNFYLLNSTRGLFKSYTTREINNQKLDTDVLVWERKYIYPITQNASVEEVTNLINKNNTFVASSMAVNPTKPEIIYLTGKISTFGKIFKSIDSGNTFSEVYSEVESGVTVVASSIDPTNSQTVFAILDGGTLIRSTDGGATWQKLINFEDKIVQFGFVPEFDNQFYVLLASKGLRLSKNGGQTWDPVNLLHAQPRISGDNQGKDKLLTSDIFDNTKFSQFQKIVPITAAKNSWLIIGDSQIWYSDSLNKPFTKLLLPLKSDKYKINDVQPDPQKGLDRLLVSINDKIFETNNRGQSWSANDKINLSSPIGSIKQIIIDKTDSQVTYLMLSNDTQGGSLFGN
ncbi:MAG: hypothetical protein H7196_01575 [candidate division SR1 bacterium]|nr:hypothetical protein [candidate division SR1 bacterium]